MTSSLPEFLSQDDYNKAVVTFPNTVVQPPIIRTSAQHVPIKLFGAKRDGVAVRHITNIGATVVKISIGTAPVNPTVAGTQYHRLLKACTGAADGLGGEIDLSKFTSDIWAWSSDAAGLSVVTVNSHTSNAMLPGTGDNAV